MELDIERLSAEYILNICDPVELFHRDLFKEQIRKLSKKWHPDINTSSDSTKVMAHINYLAQRIESNDWGKVFNFVDVNSNKEYEFRYRKKDDNGVGTVYIGKKLILFQVLKDNLDLFENGKEMIQLIKYQSKELEGNFKRFIPSRIQFYKTTDGFILTSYKGGEQIRLCDFIELYDMTPEQVVWIITGLYNFGLFMNKTQHKSFNGLSLESVFINPKHRGVHVLDGWWFTRKIDEKLLALPKFLIPFLSKNVIDEKKSTQVIDQLAIKLIGIRLLGDKTLSGSQLIKFTKYKELVQFLRSPCKDSIFEDYKAWLSVYDKMSVADINVTFNDVYK